MIRVAIGVPSSTVLPTVHHRSCDLRTASGSSARALSPASPLGKASSNVTSMPVSRLPVSSRTLVASTRTSNASGSARRDVTVSTSIAVHAPIAPRSSSVGLKSLSPPTPTVIFPPRILLMANLPGVVRSMVTLRCADAVLMPKPCQTAMTIGPSYKGRGPPPTGRPSVRLSVLSGRTAGPPPVVKRRPGRSGALLVVLLVQIEPPRAETVRRGIEDSVARHDGQPRDLYVRHAGGGGGPGRRARRKAQHAEVRRRVQVPGHVITNEVGHRQVTEVVRPIDPGGAAGTRVDGHFEDMARCRRRVDVVAAVRDPRVVPVRRVNADAGDEPVGCHRVVVEPGPRDGARRLRVGVLRDGDPTGRRGGPGGGGVARGPLDRSDGRTGTITPER